MDVKNHFHHLIRRLGLEGVGLSNLQGGAAEEAETQGYAPTISLSLSKHQSSNGSYRILHFAILSRLLVISLICFWRYLAHPYDTSASLNPSCLSVGSTIPTRSQSSRLPFLGLAIEDSIVWDGVYFVRIAECGYEYEQTYAFLPLLPICIYALSQTVFAPLVPILGYRAVLGLSGYVINNLAFLFAAVYFYRLSVLILKDSSAALRASVLFCFNPASIFYSSLYSESLYALFSLGGLYHLFSGANTTAVLLLALSGSARSNGVLNAGYFCFQAMHQSYDAIFRKNQASKSAVRVIIVAAVRTLCIFTPFILFQFYGYFNICLGSLSEEMRPWCKSRLPLLYDFIQSHYWGVGFLRYFQLKQLPNFLLAAPTLSLAVYSTIQYAKLRPEIVFSLGFRSCKEEKNFSSVLNSPGRDHALKGDQVLEKSFSSKSMQGDPNIRQKKKRVNEKIPDSFLYPIRSDHEAYYPSKQGCASMLVLPFVLHLGFMSAVAFFVMHVQVATRFLSASPPLYWFASYLMASAGRSRWGYWIWAYCAAYILLGIKIAQGEDLISDSGRYIWTEIETVVCRN
ncbi:hypothetical protein MRB53_028047 [Persea americana]|uniref:Uncharacterized protein n=1 Tax=Persea americana TaxID=3435 RepID=A0ACC2KEM5_PERAE|nr:hypothetical protein MRB53_028047 [Persea americana]